jgi:hypothetical protein
VQSLRRNVQAEQGKLVALFVRDVLQNSLVECGEFRDEGRLIQTEALQIGDCPAGSVLFRRTSQSDRLAATRCLVAGSRTRDRLLAEFVQVQEMGEFAEQFSPLVIARRVHGCAQLPQLLVLLQEHVDDVVPIVYGHRYLQYA